LQIVKVVLVSFQVKPYTNRYEDEAGGVYG